MEKYLIGFFIAISMIFYPLSLIKMYKYFNSNNKDKK